MNSIPVKTNRSLYLRLICISKMIVFNYTPAQQHPMMYSHVLNRGYYMDSILNRLNRYKE